MALHLILLGPPASGKGTQGRRLAEDMGLDYLSTGALLREAVARGSPAGRAAEPVLAAGGYVPDELMCSLMESWLEGRKRGWILDGFPRTLAQDDFLKTWLDHKNLKLDAALSLEVPKDDLIGRIRGRVECPECRWSGQFGELNGAGRCPECGGVAGKRGDDTLDNFLARYQEFESRTRPVIERHAADGSLHCIDATAPVDAVADKLLNLARSLKAHGQAA